MTWWGGSISKSFHPVCQQEELAGATQLRSSKTNGSFSCRGPDSKGRIHIGVVSLFLAILGLMSVWLGPTYILFLIYILSFIFATRHPAAVIQRCSENMQQIYWRTTFATLLNHTSAWVFFYKIYKFSEHILLRIPLDGCLLSFIIYVPYITPFFLQFVEWSCATVITQHLTWR